MKKIIHIQGMHCVSCEMILEKELQKIKDVELLMVSHKKGIMEIEYSKETSFNKVKAIIENNGFQVVEKSHKKEFDFQKVLLNMVVYLAIAVLLYLFSLFDIYKFLPDTSSLSFSGAFLVGIIASVSSCLAITGGIIIGFSRYIDNTKGIASHAKVQALFQLGRITGFFLLGGVLGYVGNIFGVSFGFTGILTFLVGILLAYMGLHILGLLPSVTKFGFHLPKTFADKISGVAHPRMAPIAGALTFFLPCGFTQTLQLLAVSSGSFLSGGLIMLFFTFGTFPVLFSVGLGASYFKEKKYGILNSIVGVLVLFFGLITVSNSYNLLGSSSQDSVPQNKQEITQQENLSVETIRVSHNGWSTQPEIITLTEGGNYKIIITPTSNGIGCMSTQVIPKLSRQVSYVQKNVPIVYDITNAKKGTYEIVCASMGMLQGKIVVK